MWRNFYGDWRCGPQAIVSSLSLGRCGTWSSTKRSADRNAMPAPETSHGLDGRGLALVDTTWPSGARRSNPLSSCGSSDDGNGHLVEFYSASPKEAALLVEGRTS